MGSGEGRFFLAPELGILRVSGRVADACRSNASSPGKCGPEALFDQIGRRIDRRCAKKYDKDDDDKIKGFVVKAHKIRSVLEQRDLQEIYREGVFAEEREQV